MSKKSRLREFEMVLAELKDLFFEEKKSEGGTRSEWLDYLKNDYENDPKYYEARVLSILMEAGIEAWGPKPDWKNKPNDPDLFTIGGIEVPRDFAFPCDGVPEGFKRVGNRYATFEQLELHLEHERERAEAVAAKCRDKLRTIRQIRKQSAGGDAQQLLFEYRDPDSEAA